MPYARGLRFCLAASLAAVFLASLPTALYAKAKHQTTDRRAVVNGVKGKPLPAMSALQRIEPPTRDVFLVDTAPDLDTVCLFRNDKARLIINIPVNKYVGPVDANGYLSNPFPMISAGIIPATVDLMMAAHDIDFDGGPPAEHDVVWLNGQRLGLLTGQDGVTKLNSFTIDIKKIKFPQKPAPGARPVAVQNRVEIEIDTASPQPNWCMSLDWIALEVPIRPKLGWDIRPAGNRMIVQITPAQDVLSIFRQTFDDDCNLTTTFDDYDKYPFSAPRNQPTAVVAELKVCPEGSMLTPSIRSEIYVNGRNAGGGRAQPSFTHTAEMVVTEPLGAYPTQIKVWVNNELGLDITRKLFPSLNPVQAFNQLVPPVQFYEKVAAWAPGATTEADALSGIVQGMFEFGNKNWIYVDNPNVQCFAPIGLVDDTDFCGYGNCHSFTAVLHYFAATAGVRGLAPHQVDGHNKGYFITHPTQSVDLKFTGNLRPIGGTTFDGRHVFLNHSLAKHGNVFYDSTFNGRYTNDRQFIALDQQGTGLDGLAKEYLIFTGGLTAYHLEGVKAYEDWDTYEYGAPAQRSVRSKFVTAAALAAMSLSAQAQFRLLDKDNDGLADALLADVEFSAPHAGSYTVGGELKKGNTVIANRPSIQSTGSSSASTNGGPGTRTVTLQFSGEQIRQTAENGPFSMVIRVSDGSGAPTRQTIQTPAYAYTQFAEYPAQISAVTEEPVDADGNDVFEGVKLRASIDVRRAGLFSVEGVLLSTGLNTGMVSELSRSLVLQPGIQQVDLVLDGTPIRRKEANGPYDITVTLGDIAQARTLNAKTGVTRPYAATDFTGVYEYGGGFTNAGVDTSGNGLFDVLYVEFAVNPNTAGPVVVRGRIESSSGNTNTETLISNAVRGSKARLQFSGESINKQKLDGPFRVRVDFENPSTGKIVDGFYLPEDTAAYNHAQFDDISPAGSITLRGFTDTVADTDGDRLADQLIVTLSVQVGQPGLYEFSGRLVDARKTEIGFFTQKKQLVRGVNLVNLVFDGRRIGAHGRDGPHNVVGLLMFGSDASLTVPNVGKTKPYTAKSFEGFVARIEGDLNKDGKIDSRDLSLFRLAYGSSISDPNYNPDADFDADMRITANDLRKMRALMARP